MTPNSAYTCSSPELILLELKRGYGFGGRATCGCPELILLELKPLAFGTPKIEDCPELILLELKPRMKVAMV